MTKIKICGLFRPEDIRHVNEIRPDWCGFIVNFPKSHRNVSPERVRELRAMLLPDIVPVGVFVNQPVEFIAELLNDETISIAQLHGHEDDKYVEALRETAPGHEIWKAFKIHSQEDLQTARESAADLVLLDNGTGTGEVFDWTLAEQFTRPFLLAGGLTPENIPNAIAALHPYGLDISSGVETEKVKDKNKIIAAVRAARKDNKL